MINHSNSFDIDSIEDIRELLKSSSSADGESVTFEAKGTNNKKKFDKDTKILISKEVCALTNTYGGVLCWHYGDKDNIQPFPDNFTSENFNSIESWLRDCLEPKLSGIDLKVVDGVYLIYIPESKTKPHRTAIKHGYYFRHSTISQEMPEIMISSMYRSQDYFDISTSINIYKKRVSWAVILLLKIAQTYLVVNQKYTFNYILIQANQ